MKILSWNVNGLKSLVNNNFESIIEELSADIICLQETKLTKEIKEMKLEKYYKYYNFTKKAGYSGVAIFSKEKAERVLIGMKEEYEDGEYEELDLESRVLTLEYNHFYIVSVYVPCTSRNNERKIYRMDFDNNFCEYIEKLNNKKDVIICGDFNVCYENKDICNLTKHKTLDIFSDELRASFKEILDLGFIDSYRYMHPQMRKYTFWTNEVVDRENSKFGWRLDYILISKFLKKNIREANILTEIKGSDHCPIELVLKI